MPTNKTPAAEKYLLSELTLDPDMQSRAATCDDAIEDYAQAIRDGRKLPPINVIDDGEHKYVTDGWQRYRAHELAAEAYISAIVEKGTRRDAIFAAIGANKFHGLRRTNKDKELAIRKMLADPDWSQWSDAMIAEHCGVSDRMVAKYRPTSETFGPDDTRTGKDGKKYPATNKKKNKPKAEPETDSLDTDFDVEKIEADDSPVNIELLATDYKSAMNAVGTVKKTLKALAEDEIFGGHLRDKITRITTVCDDLRGTIRQMEPVQLCEKCGGKGCRTCATTGFWTRAIVESRRK